MNREREIAIAMTSPTHARFCNLRWSWVRRACLAIAFAVGANHAAAQTTPEEHAKHHPGQAATTQPEASTGTAGSGMMGEMMDGMMGVPPRKELYPSLMALPDLPPDRQAEVESAAQERMQSGTQLIAEGLDQLRANPMGDYARLQHATSMIQEGASRFDSGLAARRAIAEGRSAQQVALQWFKQEMNLLERTAATASTGLLGYTWFHFSIMLSLVLFAVAMLWMYALKIRRASRLLQNLTGTTGAVPAEPSAGRVVPQEAPAAGAVQAVPTNSGSKWSGKLRIGRIFQETPDVKTFRLMNPLGGVLPFHFLPGQFITAAVPSDGKPVRRSYSISSSPTQVDYVEITVKLAPEGIVSSYLHSTVHEGDLLEFSGPAGSLVFTGRECKCILLIAGGVGITPLMSVLRYLLDRSWAGDIFLLYGCKTPEDIIFWQELQYLQRRHPNLHLVVTVANDAGADWPGRKGMITKELIAESVPDLASRYVHICGPVPMMESTKKALAELGVPLERIKTEAFGPALGKHERSPREGGGDKLQRETATSSALPMVTFVESDKSAPLPPDKVVLDVAEEAGVDIDYSCRTGVCGVCRVKLLDGKVSMAVEDGLQPGDKENQIILACQAKALENISVKA